MTSISCENHRYPLTGSVFFVTVQAKIQRRGPGVFSIRWIVIEGVPSPSEIGNSGGYARECVFLVRMNEDGPCVAQ